MQRIGTTLVEVLVAIFVMAIGLLTLLTLFPLGALSMSQAIRDDRTAQAAANAAAIAEAKNIRNDSYVTKTFIQPFPPAQNNPNGYPPITDLQGPSYPVYVDPIGFSLSGAPLGFVAGTQPPGIPRISLSSLPQRGTPNFNQAVNKWFSLQDDLIFQKEGSPGYPVVVANGLSSNAIEREGRYTWAYLLKRPKAAETKVVDMAVVVYSGRPLLAGQGEYTFTNVAFDPSTPLVTLTYAPNPKPPVKKGTWILDATLQEFVFAKPQDGGPSFKTIPHGYFYRVVGVTDPNDGKTLVLELQTNPKASTVYVYPKGSHTIVNGTLVVMENVVEVFEKGGGWLSSMPSDK